MPRRTQAIVTKHNTADCPADASPYRTEPPGSSAVPSGSRKGAAESECEGVDTDVRAVDAGGESTPAVAGVLLAAGEGRRMGVRPKSLVEAAGRPLIASIGEAMRDAGIRPLVVVLGGPHAAAIQAKAGAIGDEVVHNPLAAQGQGTSVWCGLAALARRTSACDGVLVALADQPLITADDLRALLRAFRQREAPVQMVVPRCQGRPGNPVVIDAALARDWLEAGASVVGRPWRAAHPDRVAWWDTDSDHYVIDLDEPADIAHCAARVPGGLQWPLAWQRPDDPAAC